MRQSFLLLAAAMLAAAQAAFAQPLSTAFTYQGELKQSGTPATGTFDLQFKLYDASSAGAQIGTTLCADNVAIAGGKFTTVLDFGNAFAGQKRFLEVSVRVDPTGTTPCSTATGYTTLIPRQELTAAPNAAFALTSAAATSATTAANATQLNGQTASYYLNASNFTAGSLPSALLGGSYGNLVAFTNPFNVYIGNGSNLTFLNASSITTGTVADSLLSPNIPRLNATNIFSDVNKFTNVIHSTTLGYRFPDNSVQTSAALDPGKLGFASGYPAGSTSTITINNIVFPTARMVGFLRINRFTTGSPQWNTPPTFRRPRTTDNTWFNWLQTNTTLANLRITVTFPGGHVDYDIPQGHISAYRLITGDDGLPFEEISYICGNSNLVNSLSTLTGTPVGVVEPSVAPRVGESSGNPASTTYRTVWNNVRSDVVRVVGNPVFNVPIDPSTGLQTGQVQSALVTVRANALADALNLDGGSLSRVFRLVLHPSAGADTDLTNLGITGTINNTTLRIADDGLPVEEYDITVPFVPPP